MILAKTANPIKRDPADSFEAVAKSLGCDEDKDRFEARFGKIAHAKPTAKAIASRRRKK